jgi:NAD-dependent deacetylase
LLLYIYVDETRLPNGLYVWQMIQRQRYKKSAVFLFFFKIIATFVLTKNQKSKQIMKPILVVLSGAGISAESGLGVFRGAGGLWEGYKIEEVATPEGWRANPQKVLDFYNLRRTQAVAAQPNAAHYAIAALEQNFDVQIITQNIDNLHERSGSSKVLHLHGEITKVRSTTTHQVSDIGDAPIHVGDLCSKGGQLRPHIVWFGEAVPLIETAAEMVATCDVLVVVGTSLQVYPAAGLIDLAPAHAKRFFIDPQTPENNHLKGIKHIQQPATQGLKTLLKYL